MDSSVVGGNDRGLRASFLRTFFFAIALGQNFEETIRSAAEVMTFHHRHMILRVRSGGKCVRVSAHVQLYVPSTITGQTKRAKWHNEVPNECALPWQRTRRHNFSRRRSAYGLSLRGRKKKKRMTILTRVGLRTPRSCVLRAR